MTKRSRTPGPRSKVTPPTGISAPRPSLVTLSDAETTEAARLESMRGSAPPERVTMPAPPAAIGRFSIEMHVPSVEVDYRASFERGAFREGLIAARERLSVSPADTSALRIAQRCEEALAEQLLAVLGGLEARIELRIALADDEATARELAVQAQIEHGARSVRELLADLDLPRIDALDTIAALQDRGLVRVNLSEQKTTTHDPT